MAVMVGQVLNWLWGRGGMAEAGVAAATTTVSPEWRAGEAVVAAATAAGPPTVAVAEGGQAESRRPPLCP